MPLSGTFDTMQLTDVIQWIHASHASGTLTVSVDLEDTYLVFEEGEVVAVGSDDPLRLDLGQALLARDLITEDDLLTALRGMDRDRSMADALVGAGVLAEDTVAAYQVEHVFDVVLDLFLHTDGSFHFSRAGATPALLAASELRPENLLRHPIATQRLLLDGIRQVDEWQRIQTVFPNAYVFVHALEGESENPCWLELRRRGSMLSTGELCLRLGRSRFYVYKLLYEAYQKGLVALDEQSSMPADRTRDEPVDLLFKNAQILARENQHEEAREVLATVLHLEPDNREARALLHELRAEHLESLYQLLPPHRVPVLTADDAQLAALDLSAAESFLASRLDGRWDVASLVVATPLGELDTLRALHKLLHAGILRLAD